MRNTWAHVVKDKEENRKKNVLFTALEVEKLGIKE